MVKIVNSASSSKEPSWSRSPFTTTPSNDREPPSASMKTSVSLRLLSVRTEIAACADSLGQSREGFLKVGNMSFALRRSKQTLQSIEKTHCRERRWPGLPRPHIGRCRQRILTERVKGYLEPLAHLLEAPADN